MPTPFISRTPIYTRTLETYGYELRLFGRTEAAPVNSLATVAQQIDLQRLAGSAPVLVRPSPEEWPLLEQLPWPHEQVIVVLSTDDGGGNIDPGQVAALRAAGFTVALDGMANSAQLAGRNGVALCSIDALRLEAWESEAPIGPGTRPPQLMIRNLSSAAQHALSVRLGFDLFHGSYFEKPRLTRDLSANRLQTLQLVARLQEPDISMDTVTHLVKQDLTLSYKLLRMLNSAYFGIPKQVESISRAVVFFGLQRIKNWATVLLVNSTEFQPREMLVTAMIRARMCELLATACSRPSPERYYLAGLFSLLDSIMDAPMDTILATLGLAAEIDEALLTGGGPIGDVLQTVRAFEQGHPQVHAGLRLEDDWVLQHAYLEALGWTSDTYGHML